MADYKPRNRADKLGVSPGREGPYLGIHAINIFVRDQEASLRFYVDQLGFDVAFDSRLQSGDRWVAVAPPDGTAVLALVTPRAGSKGEGLIGCPTGIVFVTENVVAKFEEWRRQGVQFLFTPRLRRFRYARPTGGAEHQAPVWGGVFTRFQDIDGNTFGLVDFDEVSREIEAQRRRAAERQETERRNARELEIAKQVQARLFPQTLPAIASLDYAGSCIQARQVGGDYYDFLDFGRGRFGFVIGDISGKGIAAALLMANLQANLRSQCGIALDEPERLLCSVNRLFYENTSESSYATLFFAEYEEGSGLLRYANCGHLPALLFRRGGAVERLESTGTVLGLFPAWNCSIEESRLHPGDLLALHTDGITESFNADGEDFGERRLIEALRRNRELAPGRIIAGIVDEVRRFSPNEQQDDITMIVAKCNPREACRE